MLEIVVLLKSPSFWFASIFVAVLVNLLSTYLYPLLHRRLESTSAQSLLRRLLFQAHFVADLDRLVVNPNAVVFELVRDRQDRDSSFGICLLLLAMMLGFASEALPFVWWIVGPNAIFAVIFLIQLAYRLRKIAHRKILLDAYVLRSQKTS